MENIICEALEKWSEFRYLLFTESGAIMTVISFLTGIIAFFAFEKKTMRGLAVLALRQKTSQRHSTPLRRTPTETKLRDTSGSAPC